MFDNIETLIIAVIIGIIVAVILELVVKLLWPEITTQLINLLSLLIGWLLGILAMFIFSGDFVTYSILGLAGGVWSPGIYDIVVKGLLIKGGDD